MNWQAVEYLHMADFTRRRDHLKYGTLLSLLLVLLFSI